jgi:hypothetical protein
MRFGQFYDTNERVCSYSDKYANNHTLRDSKFILRKLGLEGSQ